jgi:hypothetical protein
VVREPAVDEAREERRDERLGCIGRDLELDPPQPALALFDPDEPVDRPAQVSNLDAKLERATVRGLPGLEPEIRCGPEVLRGIAEALADRPRPAREVTRSDLVAGRRVHRDHHGIGLGAQPCAQVVLHRAVERAGRVIAVVLDRERGVPDRIRGASR